MIRFNLKRYLIPVLFAFSCFAAPQALAHKINLFAYAEGDEVYVESYFVDGKAAQNSKVQVLGPEGNLLLEGITDDQGQYRFAVPQHTDLKIVVNAGMGHQTNFLLSAAELNESDMVEAAPVQSSEVEVSASSEKAAIESSSGIANNSELDEVVRKAVNEAIKPLVRELSASQQKASLSGIVGGVGYIIGFLGLFAFFKVRQSTAKSGSDK